MLNMDEYPRSYFWAEHETNPAPEVMIHSAPEAVQIQLDNISIRNDGTNDVRPVHPYGDIVVPNGAEQTSQGISKRRSRLWTWKTIIGICIGLLILAIVIPVVVSVAASDRGHAHGSIKPTAGPSAPSDSSSLVTSTFSTAVAYPSSTLNPHRECVESNFIQAVNWIGIDQNMGGWKFNLHQANTAEECCTTCHQFTRDGCNGWLYMAEKSFTPACSIIHGFAGPSKDDYCPNGRPGIVFAKTDNSDNYGGPGPCAGSVRG